MSKHTPGPWVFEYRDGKHPLNDCNGSRIDGLWAINGEFILGDVTGWDGGYFGPNKANARLIAAAPDLLEALEKLLAMFDAEIQKNEYDGISMLEARLAEADFARAAIAKATA
jgi:hypothetical protein